MRSGADRGHRAAKGRAMDVSRFRAPFAAYGCLIDLFERPYYRGDMWVVASSVIIHASAHPPPIRTPWRFGGRGHNLMKFLRS